MKKSSIISYETVIDRIYIIRGKKVMLDRDLAEMYRVGTRVLNQAVNRNKKRFPRDFMFRLSKDELNDWMSQIVTSNKVKMGLRKLPYAFTEQGVAMLSSILKSEIAINVNIRIIRVFTKMREMIIDNKEILLKLKILEGKINNQDKRLYKHDDEIYTIFKALEQLLNPPIKGRKRINILIFLCVYVLAALSIQKEANSLCGISL